ncbi:MAG: hypothetical protein OEY51_04545, partial [Cyclobacteriaceae bacterium]|nr:hypothetical protein [Cyclobacteriaceae bacterium]
MKTPNEKPDIFNEFFREESSGLLEGDQPPAKGASLEEKMKEARVKLPFRVKSESVDEEIIKEKWAEAGKFFSRGTKPKNAIGIKGLYPLSLYHLTVQGQQEKTSASYPLWINNGNLENKDKYGECLPVASLLRKIIEEVAPPDQEKRFLSAWMNNLSLQLSADPETPEKGLSKLREHLGNIPEKFNLRGKEKESITGHLSTITSMLPVSGTILPYVKDPWLQILQSAITHHASQYRKNLKDKVAELSKKLNDILLVEADKAPAKSSPDSLKSSMELAGDLLDFEKLSGVLPKSSSVEMPASRLKRIQKVLTVLSAAGQFFAKTATLVTALPDLKSSGLSLLSEMDIVNPDKSGIFETAANIFEKTVSSYRDLIVAVKIGELEVQNKFDEARHEPYFENFDWKLLSDEELSGCPPVVAITEYHEIIHKGINSLLEVLTHHYPIKTLVLHQGPVFNEGMDTRHEIGAMAVAMRETFAMQGTIADARGLYRGFMEGLSAPIPALFYILNQQGDSDAGPEYWSQLALESRAFPGFVYSGNLRDDWGRRF